MHSRYQCPSHLPITRPGRSLPDQPCRRAPRRGLGGTFGLPGILCMTCMLSHVALCAGCASTPARPYADRAGQTAPVAASARADRAAAAYRTGNYEEALSMTADMLRTGDSPQVAGYLAGLAAYRLDRLRDAEQFLMTAASGSDGWITVRAEAMLGMIALETDRPARAAELLGRASTRLPSPDAEEAAHHAARAARMLGDHDRAERWDQISSNAPGTYATGRTVGRYSLQIGAYEAYASARAAADLHQPAVTRAGLGAIRIDTLVDARNRVLFAPRIGQFPTAEQAERIRRQEGWLGFLVRSVAE